MQFNSYLFILAVVPAFVLCYFLLSGLHKSAGKLAIIAFGAWFYAYGGWDSAAILGISLLVNLLASLALSGQKRFRKLTLALAILANVSQSLVIMNRKATTRQIRLVCAFSSMCWCVYNLVIKGYAGAAFNITNAASYLYNAIRQPEKEKEEK